jgi:hypothetical protein
MSSRLLEPRSPCLPGPKRPSAGPPPSEPEVLKAGNLYVSRPVAGTALLNPAIQREVRISMPAPGLTRRSGAACAKLRANRSLDGRQLQCRSQRSAHQHHHTVIRPDPTLTKKAKGTRAAGCPLRHVEHTYNRPLAQVRSRKPRLCAPDTTLAPAPFGIAGRYSETKRPWRHAYAVLKMAAFGPRHRGPKTVDNR